MQQHTQPGAEKSVAGKTFQMAVAALIVWAIPAIASAHGGNNDAGMVHACIGNISKVARIVGVGGTCIPSPPLLAETPAHWPQTAASGTPGPKGDKGDPGINGINGVDGINGINGIDGTSGARPDGPCFDNTSRFVDCGNGTVTDTLTGLIWLKQADCLGAADWASANQAAAALGAGGCGLADGSSPGDWRLASYEEWGATVSPSCVFCGPTPFTGIPLAFVPDLYWSNTTSLIDPSFAWAQDFNLAQRSLAQHGKAVSYKIWTVRGGSR